MLDLFTVTVRVLDGELGPKEGVGLGFRFEVLSSVFLGLKLSRCVPLFSFIPGFRYI